MVFLDMSTAVQPMTIAEQALGRTVVAQILGVHPRTLSRRESGPVQAQSAITEKREEKLLRVWENLSKVYRPENAAKWLRSEVPALGRRTPIDVMREDGGLERVLDTVIRMSWGVPA